jgi:hypothetical protein
MLLIEMNGYQKMCGTNENMIKMDVIIKGD